LSVQRNVWATQQHNEEILDQAFRTSKDVFLIFGVNKSGEFYGYARFVLGFVSPSRQSELAYRMAGPILHSEDRVPWASRPTSVLLPGLSAASDVEGNVAISPPARIVDGYLDLHYVFPPEEHRVVEHWQSPKVISQPQEGAPSAKVPVSASAELHDPHHWLTHPTQNTVVGPTREGIPIPFEPLSFELSADTYGDTPDQSIHQAALPTISASDDESEDILEHARDTALQIVNEVIAKDPKDLKEGLAEVWGRPFSVGWIRTEHLSFFHTKHLRNPWNHGREVKISRDGTELEPSIGRQLLEEWDKGPPSPPAADIPAASSYVAERRRSS